MFSETPQSVWLHKELSKYKLIWQDYLLSEFRPFLKSYLCYLFILAVMGFESRASTSYIGILSFQPGPQDLLCCFSDFSDRVSQFSHGCLRLWSSQGCLPCSYNYRNIQPGKVIDWHVGVTNFSPGWSQTMVLPISFWVDGITDMSHHSNQAENGLFLHNNFILGVTVNRGYKN
jgi:hypothetical protein